MGYVRFIATWFSICLAADGYAQPADWKPDRNVEFIVGAAAGGAVV